MPVSKWISILSQIASDFDSKKIMLAINGGEPLLKPDVFDLFGATKSLGFPFGMVTNATLIDDKTAERLAGCGIGSISLSFDAPPEVNDSLRGKRISERVGRCDGCTSFDYEKPGDATCRCIFEMIGDGGAAAGR